MLENLLVKDWQVESPIFAKVVVRESLELSKRAEWKDLKDCNFSRTCGTLGIQYD